MSVSSSAYVLWSHRCDNGSRLTGRFDYFAAKDHSRRQTDDNSETGYAATLAWLKPMNDHLDVAVEALHVVSDRPARATHMLAVQQAQTQLQLALKMHL
ncbi:hypothetical protein [Asticcacaulis sp. MM231]|uniref:hypothetical protein n=1 Tax=Asticcacaulis sp. MM231 TaxID=3157666 RepID=UPI0032D5AFE9